MNVIQSQARASLFRHRASFGCLANRCFLLSNRAGQRRRFSGRPWLRQDNKPYYVTSPIFYVNAEPHAGHLYTLILTDVLKRWQLLKGDTNATLLTGTDEHGMKIQKAAEKAGIDVKQFCDFHSRQFLDLSDQANISYDRFIRTTDQDHKDAVECFWRELRHRGYIYEAEHKGWYSVSDETFYPESQIHLVLDPSTGRKLHASIETGKEVEWTSETNYHFKLSDFKDRLLEHYRKHPDFVVPISRMKSITREVEQGLSDLSISRPSSRLSWGVPVPDDESQTIYVWLDALINYLTMAGYPHNTPGESSSIWPPNCQVIGKDIVRFHCIYWPAFLMALDLPVTDRFLSHAHWTMGNAKMSKSLGNGVDPFYAMHTYGVDTIRYFMTHDGGIVDDADYDNSYIVEKYKKGLQGGLGNLVSRITRSKGWSVSASVQQAADNIQVVLPSYLTPKISPFVLELNSIADKADRFMDVPNPRLALHAIMDVVYSTNKFFTDSDVWQLAKQGSSTEEQVNQIVFLTAEAIRIASILLKPFMPAKADEALDLLGVQPQYRSFEYARVGADLAYGVPFRDVGRGHVGALFPPLLTEF